MAGALAEREWAEPRRREREDERQPLTVVRRGARKRGGPAARRRPGFWLVAFAVAVSLLAVGRVTLSFAVVQKNMDTQALVREQRQLRTENVQLQEKLAAVTATPRLRQLAMERYGLVPAQDVVFLDGVSGAAAASDGATAGTDAGTDASAGTQDGAATDGGAGAQVAAKEDGAGVGDGGR